jgi:ElaB/YqjD/DUF883 family membrane-anchored ribosome-binding protein
MATREPEQIRAEIEETREQLGETVEALAEKADVKGQARARVDETKERIRHRAEDAKAKISSASPDQARGAAAGVQHHAKEKPLPYAAGGAFAAGMLFGLLVARRRGR